MHSAIRDDRHIPINEANPNTTKVTIPKLPHTSGLTVAAAATQHHPPIILPVSEPSSAFESALQGQQCTTQPPQNAWCDEACQIPVPRLSSLAFAVSMGHGRVCPVISANRISMFLESLMDLDVTSATAVGCYFVDTFTLKTVPHIAVTPFVDRVLKYANCDSSCFAVACVLIQRLLRESQPHIHDSDFAVMNGLPDAPFVCTHTGAAMRLTPFNLHRLFAAAVTVAIKSTQDVYHAMGYYALVYGLTAIDISKLERALMVLLQHRLFVSYEEVCMMAGMLLASS